VSARTRRDRPAAGKCGTVAKRCRARQTRLSLPEGRRAQPQAFWKSKAPALGAGAQPRHPTRAPCGKHKIISRQLSRIIHTNAGAGTANRRGSRVVLVFHRATGESWFPSLTHGMADYRGDAEENRLRKDGSALFVTAVMICALMVWEPADHGGLIVPGASIYRLSSSTFSTASITVNFRLSSQ
jgi:hypothetical protein